MYGALELKQIKFDAILINFVDINSVSASEYLTCYYVSCCFVCCAPHDTVPAANPVTEQFDRS